MTDESSPGGADGSPDAAGSIDVWRAVGDALDADRRAVIATVVDVAGRNYRRPGARMLVTPDGEDVGAVTPGCVEDEVRRLAAEVLADGPRVATYDLREEDVWGLGVGCNGVVDVLLAPVDPSLRPAVRAREGDGEVALGTVVDSDDDRLAVGDRVVLDDGLARDGQVTGDDRVTGEAGEGVPSRVAAAVADAADRVADGGEPRVVGVDTGRGAVDVFVDHVGLPPRLVVVGTGHDVHPVVDLAKRNGFRVTVVGFRSDAEPGRFPRADEVVATSPDDVVADAAVDGDSHVVLMTHNAVDDRIALGELLDSAAPYVGLMGPAERFEDLAAEDPALRDADTSALYTPVGLDLGGGSPYQVATSIVAEALAVANGKAGGHLADGAGFVHARGGGGGAE